MKILWLESGSGIYTLSRLTAKLFASIIPAQALTQLEAGPRTLVPLEQKIRELVAAATGDELTFCASFSDWYTHRRNERYDLAIISVSLYGGKTAISLLPQFGNSNDAGHFERSAGLWVYNSLLRAGMPEDAIALFIDGALLDFDQLCWRLCLPAPKVECVFNKGEDGFARFRHWLDIRLQPLPTETSPVNVVAIPCHPKQHCGSYQLTNDKVELLLVEDNPRYQETLTNWLTRFGYRQLTRAYSETEAADILAERTFDIIITDMRMESDASGFAVISRADAPQHPALVIVLTANETVADCRAAFRYENVWDYLSKNSKGNVFEELHHSLQAAMRYLNLWGNRADEEWAVHHSEMLRTHYLDRYIAIINNHVLDSAESQEVLFDLIRARRLPLFLPLIKKITPSKSNLRIEHLLEQKESTTLLFLPSFCKDTRTGKQNTEACYETLRAIVALLNSEGGYIVLGISNAREVYGIEQELNALSRFKLWPNGRKQEQNFREALFSMLLKHIRQPLFLDEWVEVNFSIVDGHTLAVIAVAKSAWPLFIAFPGDKAVALYRRVGAVTVCLSFDEAERYIRWHWK